MIIKNKLGVIILTNQPLTDFEILQGILSLTISILGIIIGLIVILKYFTYKRKELLGVAFAIILIALSWAPSGIAFLTFVLYGALLYPTLYIFIAFGFSLFASLCMMYAIISLLYPKPAKKILLTFLIISIVFEVIFVYLLFTNIEAVGTMAGKFDVNQRE